MDENRSMDHQTHATTGQDISTRSQRLRLFCRFDVLGVLLYGNYGLLTWACQVVRVL